MMTEERVRTADTQELVELFVKIGLAQYDAAFVNSTKKYNRLYQQMMLVREELKRRPGDERRALRPLLAHPNAQVRMKAAHSLLALFPVEARKAIESVRDSNIEPQNGDAASTLRALDEGFYVPT